MVHDAVDFISTVDTPAPWELNIWYHTLNCGYRARISGETDFPCIYGERVGLGRVYVKLADGKLDFDRWCEGIKEGRSYVSDGKSHLVDFRVDDVGVGRAGGERKLDAPARSRSRRKVAAYLEPELDRRTRASAPGRSTQKPYWDIERARIGETRTVPVEVVVNGHPVARKEIAADGTFQDVAFDVKIDRSSWVALRIYPSSHTNPVFVTVGGKPIRASKKSAEWCLKGVDQCWSQKERAIRAPRRRKRGPRMTRPARRTRRSWRSARWSKRGPGLPRYNTFNCRASNPRRPSMSAKPATAEKTGLVLVRLGVGKQEFDLPDGSTLGDPFAPPRLTRGTR